MKETWTKAVSDAQGHATTMVCELRVPRLQTVGFQSLHVVVMAFMHA